MEASDIVERIGKGVQAALKTNQLFLGIEQFEFENADIHPEYITTVKVGEQFTEPEYIVSLETQMKTLRRDAKGIVRLKNCVSKSAWESAGKTIERLDNYKFGKKDRERIDILVRPFDAMVPPVLVGEVKLGVRNLKGITTDIDRIMHLLCMYEEADLLKRHRMYGAVVFHLMLDGKATDALSPHASNLLAKIRDHLKDISSSKPWLKHRADLLHSFQVSEPVSGYREFHEDGTVENVFGKDRFTLAPGLVLLGTVEDVETVDF